MDKKGNEGLKEIMKWVIAFLVLALLIFALNKNLRQNAINSFKSVTDGFLKTYSDSELTQENAYGFIAQSIDISEDITQYSLNGKTCEKNKDKAYTYNCLIGVAMDFKVIVKNTGSDVRSLYARPKIGLSCNKDAECKEESWLESTTVCSPLPGETANCITSSKYTFDKKGEYRIYPRVMCPKEECSGEESLSKDAYSFNKDNWITVVVS